MTTFTCPACGHETTYRPDECELLIRYKPDGEVMKEVRYRLVRCAG
jgi:transcription elongation factor Elf1